MKSLSHFWLKKSSTLFIFVAILSSACAQKKKQEIESSKNLQVEQQKLIEAFEKGNSALDKGEHEAAAKIYDRVIQESPVSSLGTLIIYNSGIAYYEMKNCEEAAQRFRKVIRIGSQNQNKPLVSRSMLFMGDVYSCLGEDNKSIANLVELYRGDYPLDAQVIHAELPAKLAAAYARIGNSKEAEKYFRIAERGLLQLLGSQGRSNKLNIAKTLFLMGNLSQLNFNHMSSEDYFATIRAMQKYLYRSVAYGDEGWSKKAYQQLDEAYRNGWAYVDNIKLPAHSDPAIANRQKTEAQLQIAQQAVLAVNELLNARIPGTSEPPIVRDLTAKMHQHQMRYKNFIATNLAGTALTPEALQAQGIKKMGRVLNPDPILERKAKGRR